MTDDELLRQLADVLSPPPDAPSPAEPQEAASLLALRAAVQGRADWPAVRSPRRTRSSRGFGIRVAMPTFVGALIVAGSGTAFAVSGTPLPTPVRSMAHAAGLPVDSTEVASTRTAEADLRSALAHRDRTAIVAQSRRLQHDLGSLSADDRKSLGRTPDALLAAADESDEGPAGGGSTRPFSGATSGGHQDRSPTTTTERPTTSHGSVSDGARDASANSHEDESPSASNSSGRRADTQPGAAQISNPPTTASPDHGEDSSPPTTEPAKKDSPDNGGSVSKSSSTSAPDSKPDHVSGASGQPADHSN